MTSTVDQAVLEREGASAAQAGRSWQSNPYLQRENMPMATGETLREWSRKHDAWQRGFETAMTVAAQTTGIADQPAGGGGKSEP